MGLVGLDLEWVDGDERRKGGVETERRLSLVNGLNIDGDEMVAIAVVAVAAVEVEDTVKIMISCCLLYCSVSKGESKEKDEKVVLKQVFGMQEYEEKNRDADEQG